MDLAARYVPARAGDGLELLSTGSKQPLALDAGSYLVVGVLMVGDDCAGLGDDVGEHDFFTAAEDYDLDAFCGAHSRCLIHAVGLHSVTLVS